MLRRALVVLTLCAALVGGTTSSAGAEDVVLRDGVGDVWRYPLAGGEPDMRPRVIAGDVRKAWIRHDTDRVVTRMTYDGLRRFGPLVSYRVRILTGAGVYREVVVDASRRIGWQGALRVFNRAGSRVDCAARHRISYLTKVVTISVPRSCLGSPRSVRVSATSFWVTADHDFMVDNPHVRTEVNNTWTEWVRAG